MNKLGEKIKNLKLSGLTCKQICIELDCAISTVYYHLYDKRKRDLNNYKHIIKRKIEKFSHKFTYNNNKISKTDWKSKMRGKINTFSKKSGSKKTVYQKPKFTVDDVIKKFGETTNCYLTGKKINMTDTSSYHFDHIIPRSKGGDNSINNLGICIKEANIIWLKAIYLLMNFMNCVNLLYLIMKIKTELIFNYTNSLVWSSLYGIEPSVSFYEKNFI